jgi:hypothetical protein
VGRRRAGLGAAGVLMARGASENAAAGAMALGVAGMGVLAAAGVRLGC